MPLEDSENNPDSHREEGDSDQDQGKPDQQISATLAEPDKPRPNTNGKKSRKCKKHWLEYATFGVEILGIVGLAIYALLTLGIYRESKKSVVETQRQMRIDERPWLKIATSGDQPEIPMPDEIFVGQPLKIPFEIKNFGKTAARQIQSGFVIQITPNGESTQIKGVKPSDVFKTGVLYPTDILKKRAVRLKMNSSGSAAVDLVMPEELQEIRAGKAHVTFWGEVWYSDIFGVSHWTQYCTEFFVENTDNECSEFNDVDSNDGTNKTEQTTQ